MVRNAKLRRAKFLLRLFGRVRSAIIRPHRSSCYPCKKQKRDQSRPRKSCGSGAAHRREAQLLGPMVYLPTAVQNILAYKGLRGGGSLARLFHKPSEKESLIDGSFCPLYRPAGGAETNLT